MQTFLVAKEVVTEKTGLVCEVDVAAKIAVAEQVAQQ